MKKKIVVTGSAGFIAPHLIDALDKNKHEILCLCRNDTPPPKYLIKNNIGHSNTDICNLEQLKSVIESFNPNIIYHLASQADNKENFEHSTQCIKHNILGTLNLLEAFRLCSNAEVFVYGDSVKVYGNTDALYSSTTYTHPNSSYAIGKLAGWFFCELYGKKNKFNAISVRPTLIFGPGQPVNIISYIIESVLNNKQDVTLQGGNQTRSPLYIHDAIDAYLKATDLAQHKHGLVMNIGGNEELKIIDIARMITNIMHSDLIINSSTDKMRSNEILSSSVKLEETKEQFGWSPKTSLKDALTYTIESYYSGLV